MLKVVISPLPSPGWFSWVPRGTRTGYRAFLHLADAPSDPSFILDFVARANPEMPEIDFVDRDVASVSQS